mgnify:CR=1 FL=1
MKKHLYILILILFFSCNNNKEYFTSFPQNFKLEGKIISLEQNYRNGIIDFYDSLLIISSTMQSPYLIHFYNKNDFNYISSTGKRGSGPGEISSPGLGCIDNKEGVVWYRDMGRKKLWKFGIAEALTNKDYIPSNSNMIPTDIFFIDFNYFHNGIFSFSNTNQEIFISYFNEKGEQLDSLNVRNDLKIYEKIDEQSRKYTSNYLYTSNIDRGLHAIAYRFCDVFSIIDSNGGIVSINYGPGRVRQKPDLKKLNQIITNYEIASNEEFIFCLYLGEKKFNEEKNSPMFPKVLHIYDWTGTPLVKLELNYTVMSFSIDNDSNRIVTFSPETGGLIYYNIPDF